MSKSILALPTTIWARIWTTTLSISFVGVQPCWKVATGTRGATGVARSSHLSRKQKTRGERRRRTASPQHQQDENKQNAGDIGNPSHNAITCSNNTTTVSVTKTASNKRWKHLICEELHAESAVDDVPGRPLEAGVDDADEGWCEGVVVLELHRQTHVVQLLVLFQTLHVLVVQLTLVVVVVCLPPNSAMIRPAKATSSHLQAHVSSKYAVIYLQTEN